MVNSLSGTDLSQHLPGHEYWFWRPVRQKDPFYYQQKISFGACRSFLSFKIQIKKELESSTVGESPSSPEQSISVAAAPSREAAVPVGALSRLSRLCYCECHVTNPLSMPRSRRENKRGEVRTLPINRSQPWLQWGQRDLPAWPCRSWL